MPWTENLNLNLAWRRILTDMKDDPYPDMLHYKDVRMNLDSILGNLLEEVEIPQNYRPHQINYISIPKIGFSLRPTGAMNIKDRLLYQAIADFLAPHYSPEDSVYSYIFNDTKSYYMFKPGVKQWKKFQEKVEDCCQQYAYLLETDLTGYFEHINHYRLLHRIDDIFQNQQKSELRPLKQLLGNMLRHWNARENISIPQIMNPSSFFGNIYMDEFDKWVKRRGYEYLRYVDDIRIFTNTKIEARLALAEIIEILRKAGLFISSAKTRIVETKKVLDEFDEHRETMDIIDDAFDSMRRSEIERIVPKLEDFFLSIINDKDYFRDKHFRFCIYRYRKLKAYGLGGEIHRPIVNAVLDELPNRPHATDVFSLYLSLFPGVNKVTGRILDFLQSDYNIYPWQEMNLLDVLTRITIKNEKELNEEVINYVRGRWQSRDLHPCIRTRAIILLGKLGDYEDRMRLKDAFFHEQDVEIKKAILVAIQEISMEKLKYFHRQLAGESEEIELTVEYLKSLNQPKYHYFNPPNPVDFKEDEDDLVFDKEVEDEDLWY